MEIPFGARLGPLKAEAFAGVVPIVLFARPILGLVLGVCSLPATGV